MGQEIKPSMIEPLKPKQSLKVAELQDGDIICFQKTSEKGDGDSTRSLHESYVVTPAPRHAWAPR